MTAGEKRPSQAPDRTFQGIALMVAALACFAGLDTIGKWLSPRLGTIEVVWARYAAGFLLVLLFVNPVTVPGVTRTRRPALQALRSVLLLLSTVFNFLALRDLQLAEVMSIVFLMPLIVALLAGPILGEWAGPRRLAAIGVGFLGVLVITRPGLETVNTAVFWSLASVFCYALYNIVTRLVAPYDPTTTTLFYSQALGVVVLSVIVPFVWVWPTTTLEWGLMLGMGACGAFGHFLLILAHRVAPAPVLAPFIYTQMIWMVILGYLVFGDLPDVWTLLGGGIVVASGLYLLHRERLKARDKEPLL